MGQSAELFIVIISDTPTNTTQGSSFLFLFHPLNLQNTTWIAYIHCPKNPTAHPFYLPSQSIKKKIWLMEKKTLEVYMVSILLLYTSMGRDKQQRGDVRSLDNVRCVKCQKPWPLPKLSERLITRSSQLHSVLKLAMFPFPFFFFFVLFVYCFGISFSFLAKLPIYMSTRVSKDCKKTFSLTCLSKLEWVL